MSDTMDFQLQDSSQCLHCGCDFADHDYVKDSIDLYKCPRPVQESMYGSFHGGDPRTFFPDPECSTKEERERHRKACELWDAEEAKGNTPTPEACPSGWIYDDNGTALAHVLRCPYGLGISTLEYESFFEAREDDEPQPLEEKTDDI